MFDRHAQRPNRWQNDDSALFVGEWFELDRESHDYMMNVLPPLWMRGDMFAMREFLTDSITSIFLSLTIDGRLRYFHGYCDLADRGSPDCMKVVIIERESRPVRAMTHEERLEHIWSAPMTIIAAMPARTGWRTSRVNAPSSSTAGVEAPR
jgi:hypothetical protein